VLFEIRLQGCKVDGVDAAGQAHGDDVISSYDIAEGLDSTLLTRRADKRHTDIAGGPQSVPAIAACQALRGRSRDQQVLARWGDVPCLGLLPSCVPALRRLLTVLPNTLTVASAELDGNGTIRQLRLRISRRKVGWVAAVRHQQRLAKAWNSTIRQPSSLV
jgi:hypothetical protein